jgi:hypothetical protein
MDRSAISKEYFFAIVPTRRGWSSAAQQWDCSSRESAPDEEARAVILQPIDYVVYAWLLVALASAAYVALDQFQHNPEATVMKWGFVLITLYMGPIGLLLYVMADKEPAPGTHEARRGSRPTSSTWARASATTSSGPRASRASGSSTAAFPITRSTTIRKNAVVGDSRCWSRSHPDDWEIAARQVPRL